MRKRRDFFWIRSCRKTYDRDQGKFSFNIQYSTAVKLSPRTRAVAEAFGLGVDEEHTFTVLDTELKIHPNDVVYVTGDSGSGKSVLLRAIKQDLGPEALDIADVQVDKDKPLIETVGETLEEGLQLLAKVGLSDAFLFLRSFNELSDGQKYRYRIAKLMESKAQFWILDEFAATLDRDTAKIVSFNLQKLARQEGRCVIAATTHSDLAKDLNPDVHVHKRFGKEIEVTYGRKKTSGECSLVREMHVEEGSIKDWHALAGFHYRSHRVPAPRKIFCLKRGWNELCGVIVYSYPASTSFGRRLVMPKMSMKEMNQKLNSISRVVVHPKYRTVGLGSKLIRDTLPLAGTEYVEMSAVMAKYNPFAEKAGMTKVAIQDPPKEALRLLEVLKKFGFNPELLASGRHVKEILEALPEKDIVELRTAFSKNRHMRFSKSFSYHMPYGTVARYQREIKNASLEKLGVLIRICGFLLQSKVYLYWQRN
jgi:ABC-type transport system involved in cytochrome c biogenesis ATPase subunit/GNAT superfamily N-acetyltransferase